MTHSTTRSGVCLELVADKGSCESAISEHSLAQRQVADSGWSNRDGLSMELASVDPVLVEIVDEVVRRMLGGELVDEAWLSAAYPDRAEAILNLLPSMNTLTELARANIDATIPASADGEASSQKIFGDFRIIRTLGRGGMGVVYEAEQLSLGRKVALKLVPVAAVLDPQALKRFQLEAQVAGCLRHPRIVPVYASGTIGDVPYYVMQLIEGGSLADLIAELRGWEDRGADSPPRDESSMSDLTIGLLSGRFALAHREFNDADFGATNPSVRTRSNQTWLLSIRSRTYIQTVVRLVMQAAEAIEFAHDRGVVHRDIKPANLLLDNLGNLWVADFGMAAVTCDAGLTTTGDLPGTLRYMSPEQAQGRRALVDRRTDVYALGATLYELLTLQPAFGAADRQEVFRRIIEDEPEPIRKLNPAVPADLATIVAKALAKEPSSRYDTAWQFGDDLVRFIEGRPITARPVTKLARTWLWCRRKPWQAGLTAALLLAILIGFAGITWNWRAAVRQEQIALQQKSLLLISQSRAEASEKKALLHAAKADAINHFLIQKLLRQASPENNPAARKLTLFEVLDRAAAEVGTSFDGQPEIEAAIRMAIGETYHDLGDYAKSTAHYRVAHELYGGFSDESPENRLSAMAELGHSLTHLNRLAEAEPLLVAVVDESARLLGRTHDCYLKSVEYLGNLRQRMGRSAEAEAIGRQLVEESLRARGPKHPDTLTAMNNLGTVLEKTRKYAEAEHLFRQCLVSSIAIHGVQHPSTIQVRYNLGFVLADVGRLDEAESHIRQSTEQGRIVLGPEHPHTLRANGRLGALLAQRGQIADARNVLRATFDAQCRTLGATHPDTVRTSKFLDDLPQHSAKLAGVKVP